MFRPSRSTFSSMNAENQVSPVALERIGDGGDPAVDGDCEILVRMHRPSIDPTEEVHGDVPRRLVDVRDRGLLEPGHIGHLRPRRRNDAPYPPGARRGTASCIESVPSPNSAVFRLASRRTEAARAPGRVTSAGSPPRPSRTSRRPARLGAKPVDRPRQRDTEYVGDRRRRCRSPRRATIHRAFRWIAATRRSSMSSRRSRMSSVSHRSGPSTGVRSARSPCHATSGSVRETHRRSSPRRTRWPLLSGVTRAGKRRSSVRASTRCTTQCRDTSSGGVRSHRFHMYGLPQPT